MLTSPDAKAASPIIKRQTTFFFAALNDEKSS